MYCKKSNLIRKKENKKKEKKVYFRYIRYNLFIHNFDTTFDASAWAIRTLQ